MPVIDRGVDVDGETLGLCRLYGGDGAVEYALLANRLVVVLAQSVQMHGEEEIRRGLEQMQLLLQKQRIGAERDELLLGHEAFDDICDLAVNERLASRNGDHGRAALIGGIKAFLDGEATVEDRIGIVDFAATDASKIAAEERLEHQHQRIAFAPKQLLLEDVGADAQLLEEWDSHFL